MTTTRNLKLESLIESLRGADLVAGMIFAELISERDRDEAQEAMIRKHCPSLTGLEIIVLTADQVDALIHAFSHLSASARAVHDEYHTARDAPLREAA